MAVALKVQRRYSEAISEYSEVISAAEALGATSQVVGAFIDRGACYLRQEPKDIGAALRDFSRYIQSKPDETTGYSWQAEALMELGDLEPALNSITRAITLSPGDGYNYV